MGAYDDFGAQPAAPARSSASVTPGNMADALAGTLGANAYSDFVPPKTPERPSATAADRVQAAEAGLLRGGVYLASMPADIALNVENLVRAGAGFRSSLANATTTAEPTRTPGGLYHYLTPEGIERFSKEPPPPGAKPVTSTTHPIPAWADPANDPTMRPFAAGQAATELMDTSPVTTTQVARPDDPASRYLSAATSVVPGVLAGGGSIPQTARALAAAAPGAVAGQAVAERRPFESDAANNAASILAQALATRGAAGLTRGPGELIPANQTKNAAVTAGQEAGYEFPPATTNPSVGNRALESVAGKVATQQHASLNNQGVTNEGFREDFGLPESRGSPVSDLEIAQAKAQAAPAYDALRGAGQIQVTPTFAQQLSAALTKSQGAARLSPKLGSSELEGIVSDLKGQKSFDAGDAMNAMSALRDKASEAYRAGNSTAGAGFRSASKALEDAIDQHLSSQGGAAADMLNNYRDSRRQFAQIASYEDARNPITGNIDATKLAAALKKGEPLSGRSLLAAQAAGQAPKAFAEPSSSPASHLSAWGALGAGLLAAHEYLPDHAGLAGALTAAAVPLTRMGARSYVLGPGQSNALPRAPAPFSPGVIPGAVVGGASTLGANR